jgi:hypothetical protein
MVGFMVSGRMHGVHCLGNRGVVSVLCDVIGAMAEFIVRVSTALAIAGSCRHLNAAGGQLKTMILTLNSVTQRCKHTAEDDDIDPKPCR